jgi:hypothetical protein
MTKTSILGVALAILGLGQQVLPASEPGLVALPGNADADGGAQDAAPSLVQQGLKALWGGSPSSVVYGGCPAVCWKEGCGLFADFLYLRPSNDQVPVAVPINGAIVPPPGSAPVQAGETAIADLGFVPAFRVGGWWGLDECARIGIAYTRFEGASHVATAVSAPIVLRSLVSHPGTFAAPTDFLDAAATQDIGFQLADVDYRRIWWTGDRYLVHYVLGARYAHLGQTFDSTLSNSTTVETVNTHLRFDGAGLRLGLGGERHAACSGWMIYGAAAASFLGGVSGGDYLQRNSTAAVDPLVINSWSDDRLVPILELEAGIGWTSQSGCFRVKAGYLVTSWFNVPTTENCIRAVHQNRTTGMEDTLTFDGLDLRCELHF